MYCVCEDVYVCAADSPAPPGDVNKCADLNVQTYSPEYDQIIFT